MQHSREKIEKDQQKLNICDLGSTFNASNKIYIFGGERQQILQSKIKTEQHDENLRFNVFHGKCMQRNIAKKCMQQMHAEKHIPLVFYTLLSYTCENLTTCQQDVFATGL